MSFAIVVLGMWIFIFLSLFLLFMFFFPIDFFLLLRVAPWGGGCLYFFSFVGCSLLGGNFSH